MRYAEGRWADHRWDRILQRQYLVGGRSQGTAAAADECVCNLWNPSSDHSLWVVEFGWGSTANPAALDPLRLRRTTTAGTTPSVTVTPDVDNDFAREIAPTTGAVLYLANFATEPVLAAPELYRLTAHTVGAPQFLTWLFPNGIRVPPGTGLALATTGAVAGVVTDITFRFYE